jgi:hypothetical protein
VTVPESIQSACWLALTGIIGAISTFVIRYFNRRTEMLDEDRKRAAAFDAASVIEERSRKGSGVAQWLPIEKLDAAVQLANDATPERIRVTSTDVEAALPRVRASMATPASVPPLPISVTVVGSVPPPEEGAQLEHPTLPRPAPLPRDTAREKAPLR